MNLTNKSFYFIIPLLLIPLLLFAASENQPLSFAGIRVEFFLFALTLFGVALFHNRTFEVALTGLLAIVAYKFFFDSGYHFQEHFLGTNGLGDQLTDKNLRHGECSVRVNLFVLLLGFGIIAKLF